MIYYGTRISENMSIREPEGYLICKDVPIGRAGMQKYLASELQLEGDSTRLVPVYREEKDVFSKACIASFEGMPFTDNHPEDGVDTDNISYLQKGHAQNIRRGSGAHSNELIADLIVTDPFVIDEIRNGKREISCGYNFELDEKDGKFYQRQIRGNHIALVDQGRAGHSVCIKDSKPKMERKITNMEKKSSMLFRMFKSFVNDADTTTEEIETAADEIQEIMVATDPDNAAKSLAGNTKPAPNTKVEDDAPAAMPDKQDQIIALLQQLVAQKGTDAVEEEETLIAEGAEPVPGDEDPLDKLEGELAPEEDEAPKGPTEGESHFVAPEELNEMDEDPTEELPMENVPTEDEFPDEVEEGKEAPAMKVGKDAAVRMAIDAIRPYIASLPKNQRRAAADAAVKQLRTQMGKDAKPSKNGYVAIKAAKRAVDSAPADAGRSLGKRIQAARNCNYKK